jgi:hypothetical protein
MADPLEYLCRLRVVGSWQHDGELVTAEAERGV